MVHLPTSESTNWGLEQVSIAENTGSIFGGNVARLNEQSIKPFGDKQTNNQTTRISNTSVVEAKLHNMTEKKKQ